MRGLLTASLVLGPGLAWAAGPGGADTLRRSFPSAGIESVRIDLRWGELEIQATDADDIEIVLTRECRRNDDRCNERLADVDIEGDRRGKRLELEVTGLARWEHSKAHVRVVARVPRQQALVVDMGAGEVTVEGFGSDVEVDLGAGEVRVRMAEDSVGRVDLRAGVGDTTLRRPGGGVAAERARLVGSTLNWDDGPGRALVDCRVGAGEVDVRLE